MVAKEINETALDLLSKQDFTNAQNLFFKNAKENPSHETYNNLGYYLVSEGLICKNGTFRNAYKLGIKYLLKAANLKDSVVNLCALAKAIDYELRIVPKSRKEALYQQSYKYLNKAIEIEFSDELKYNCVRLLCLLNCKDENILINTRDLIKNFICRESISLYFELLRINSLINEGLQCIENYSELLDEIDLLMFYTKFGLYEKGYFMCESVCTHFSADKFIASAIIECCINTCHFKEAEIYAQKIKHIEDNIQYDGKENWIKKVFNNLNSSTSYRKKLITEYRAIPPFITPCCYFGCKIHKTAF